MPVLLEVSRSRRLPEKPYCLVEITPKSTSVQLRSRHFTHTTAMFHLARLLLPTESSAHYASLPILCFHTCVNRSLSRRPLVHPHSFIGFSISFSAQCSNSINHLCSHTNISQVCHSTPSWTTTSQTRIINHDL